MKQKFYAEIPLSGGLTAVLVGKTQSNMSAPNATHTTKSIAYLVE